MSDTAKGVTVRNPVLRGFHPDPSICRVGERYYLATSTFEWYPGVLIYDSEDLATWTLRARPLDRLSLLNMSGNPAGGGVWAPALSHDGQRFYLIYTDVKSRGDSAGGGAGFKDSHNYLTTAATIDGPWSEPVYLNSSGFDPSLFHDEDGRKWLVNMRWDHRVGRNQFSGILLQEYDPRAARLVGPAELIFPGTEIGFTEAPHLYKRNGWYYLMVAEGGTSYGHAVVLARSRQITGPYELHPQTPLLTSVRDRAAFDAALAAGVDPSPYLHDGLQKAGHGSMAPVTESEWVLAHLCGRPLPGGLYCPLGRETALQKLTWGEDDWPWPENPYPAGEVNFSLSPAEGAADGTSDGAGDTAADGAPSWIEEFDGPHWAPELQTLRLPADDRYRLSERSGWLTLSGAESPTSRFRQSLLARRVHAFRWSAETTVVFEPESFQQLAGLSVRYNEANQLFLHISRGDDGGRALDILAYENGTLTMPGPVKLPAGIIELGVDADEERIRFRWREPGGTWRPFGPDYDPAKLSDDYAEPLGFTGTFVGVAAYDLSGGGKAAEFDYVRYRER